MKNSRKNNRRYGILISGMIIGIGALVSVAFFVERKIQREAVLAEMALALQEGREKRLENLPIYKEQYESVRAYNYAIVPIVSLDHIVDLIQILEDIADKSGVDIELTAQDASQGASEMKKRKEEEGIPEEIDPADISIRLSGSYGGIMQFLFRMEQMPFLSTVRTIVIKAEESKKSQQIDRGNGIFSTTAPIEDRGAAKTPVGEPAKMLTAEIAAVFYKEK